MISLGKLLIFAGFLVVVVGCAVLLMAKISGDGKLPGDVLIKRDNFTFYFPLATCVLISLIFSLIMWVVGRK